MRNDFKDEPVDIPSLMVDDSDSFESTTGEAYSKVKNRNMAWLIYLILFLFIVNSVGMIVLFWASKQVAVDVRHQLDKSAYPATLITETNTDQFNNFAKQVSKQQIITKENLENIRRRYQQLESQLNSVLAAQKAMISQQADHDSRLIRIEQELTVITKSLSQADQAASQLKLLSGDLDRLKGSQALVETLSTEMKTLQNLNLTQVIQSLQGDLLLLRTQVDNVTYNESNQKLLLLQRELEKKLQEVQNQLNTIRQQLNNRSPY